MKKQRKIYFLLTAEQWLGVAVLVILVVGTLMAVKHFQPEKEEDSTWINDSTMTHFTAHQAQQDSIRKTEWKSDIPVILLRFVCKRLTLIRLIAARWCI